MYVCMYVSMFVIMYLSVCSSIHLFFHLPIHPSIYIYLSPCLYIYFLSMHLFIYLSICLSIYLLIYPPADLFISPTSTLRSLFPSRQSRNVPWRPLCASPHSTINRTLHGIVNIPLPAFLPYSLQRTKYFQGAPPHPNLVFFLHSPAGALILPLVSYRVVSLSS